MKRFLTVAMLGTVLASGVGLATAPAASAAPARLICCAKIDGVVVKTDASNGRVVGPPGFRFNGMTHAQVARHMAARKAAAQPAARPAAGNSAAVRAQVVRFALAQRGKPYRWGATGPSAYDCSGLTGAAYRSAGVRLPRVSAAQARAGRIVPLRAARAGDLVYSPGHIGIALGDGRMVAAPRSGDVVKVQRIYFRSGWAVQVR